MRREIPERWLKIMERQKPPLHSLRDLSRASGLAVSTVSAVVFADRPADETSVEAIADALKIGTDVVYRLRGEVELPPFRLPREANRLTERQRQAVLSVVRAMLQPAEEQPERRLRVARRPSTPKQDE